MNKFLKTINEAIDDQIIISFELTRKGVTILWSGYVLSISYDIEGLHFVGDGIELNLEINDKNIEESGDNFVIETDDFSIFFNTET